ncbi:MAG: preprotein translocase subunit SecE [Clostridia bacterium]|nr:preprotein translocase subunit SecE [Clostridia bacterium]
MLTWGFLLLVGGIIACLVFFFSNMTDIIGHIQSSGFGGYVAKFFDPANLSTAKVVFMIVAVLAVLGLVLYIVGRIRNRGNEEKNPVVPAKVSKYLRDTRGEFKKIVWPNFPTVVKNTGVVLAMCAVTAVVIIAVDSLSGLLVKLLLNL